ncbi:MAG TPA: histidine phosphatase family protein [Opitutaceae bacterium]
MGSLPRRRFLAILAPSLLLPRGWAAGPFDLKARGTVIMLRHAYAPGIGDPAGFDLADCHTQRNLSDEGRTQARALGAQLRAAGLSPTTRVFTSPWCRCRETARLLGLEASIVLEALSSFFARSEETDRIMTALREFLRRLPTDGPPIVMVTHQVNLSALTDEFMQSGEGVVLRLTGTREPIVVGKWQSRRDSDEKQP